MEITLSKNKPVVEDIAISKDKLDEFNSLLKKQSQNKNRTIREYYRGVCTVCAQISLKESEIRFRRVWKEIRILL